MCSVLSQLLENHTSHPHQASRMVPNGPHGGIAVVVSSKLPIGRRLRPFHARLASSSFMHVRATEDNATPGMFIKLYTASPCPLTTQEKRRRPPMSAPCSVEPATELLDLFCNSATIHSQLERCGKDLLDCAQLSLRAPHHGPWSRQAPLSHPTRP